MTDQDLLNKMHDYIAKARRCYEEINDEYIQFEYVDIGEALADFDIDMELRRD